MTLRFLLVFAFINITQRLLAQGPDTPQFLVENVNFKPVTDSKNTLFFALVATLTDRQAIYSREYSIEPDSIVRKSGMTYAVWNLESGEEAMNITIKTIIQKLGSEEGVCHGNTKRLSYIESEGKTYKKRFTRKSRSLWNFAKNLYRGHNSDAAIDIYDILIEISPEKFNSYAFKGISLARIGEFDEAMYHIEVAEKLAENQKDKSQVIYAKANYYALLGDKQKCIAYLNEAILSGYDPLNEIVEDPNLGKVLKEEEITEIYTLAEKNRPNRF